MDKILVFTPTYNEKDNVKRLYQEIKNFCPEADILFCDDNSPDGTGITIDELVVCDASVKVIHRKSKMGLGTATREAFQFAKLNNYDYLITMDADFTHHPRYIPEFLAQKNTADIVIGSRYISGGKMSGWNAFRLPFTHLWRAMIKYGLGMPYDCTGAFRLYKVSILDTYICDTVTSRGFSFCMESLYRFKQHGACISEIPILAEQRTEGKSKLSTAIMTECARKYLSLVAERFFLKKKNSKRA